ncbi:MAG: hypothetical protein K5694_01770 [Bacilli bacterium]|nr:hypothetical protein [Bacilli bacterium]
MYKEELYASNVAKLFAIYDCAFVDTCSLMDDSFPYLMDVLVVSKKYWNKNFQIVVSEACTKELESNSKKTDEIEKRFDALRALTIIKKDQRWFHKRLLTIKKAPKDSIQEDGYVHADNVLITEINSLRIHKKVLLITQDKRLADNIRQLNNMESSKGRFINVYRLSIDGCLEENPGLNHFHSRNIIESVRFREENRHEIPKNLDKLSRTPLKVERKSIDTSKALVADILRLDKDIAARLSSPDTSATKRLFAINLQISNLTSIGEEERKKLKLVYPLEKLLIEKKKLTSEKEKPVQNPPQIQKEAKPVKTEVKKVEKLPQPETKPAEKKETPKEIKVTRFEDGETAMEAVIKALSFFSIIVRDPKIPYVKEIHGPADITTESLPAFDEGKITSENGLDVVISNVKIHISKREKNYRATATMDKSRVEELTKPLKKDNKPKAKPEDKPQEKPVEKPSKSQETQPVTKAEEEGTPTIVKKDPEKKEEPKEEKPTFASSTNSDSSVVEVHIGTLDEKPSKPKAKKKSAPKEKPAPKEKVKKEAQPVSEAKVEPKPKKTKKAAKVSEEKKPEEKPAPQTPAKEKPKKESKASAPKEEKKPQPEAKAKKSPKKKEAPVKTEAESILENDNKLRAKINNPTYPNESRIADLKAQLAKIATLSPEDKAKLHFTEEKIQSLLKELESK